METAFFSFMMIYFGIGLTWWMSLLMVPGEGPSDDKEWMLFITFLPIVTVVWSYIWFTIWKENRK